MYRYWFLEIFAMAVLLGCFSQLNNFFNGHLTGYFVISLKLQKKIFKVFGKFSFPSLMTTDLISV